MLNEHWLIPLFATVAVVTWLAVGGIRLIAPRCGMLSVPNERSSHSHPIPWGGGLALIGINVGAWIFVGFVQPLVSYRHALAFILGALLIGTVSLLDDMSHVPYPIRLAVHALAAAVFMAGYGYWHSITVPFFGSIPLGPAGIWLTMLWIVGLINAYNFMDGIDGLAAGHSVAAALGWVLLGWLAGRPLLMTLGVVLAASSLGFLAHNWQPARIFMGDVGSTLLGYSFAVLPLIASRADPRMALAGALLVWPAIFDPGFTVLRRLIRGENIFIGHRTFLFHRLVNAGWSHASAALLYLPLPILGALLAYSWEWGTRFLHALAIIVLIAACVGLWLVVRRGERKPAAYAMQADDAMRIQA